MTETKRIVSRLTAAAWLASFLLAACSPASAGKPQRPKVEQLYTQHCAACHGPNLEGGNGKSLVDGAWELGGTDEALRQMIHGGRPEMGMPAFGQALAEDQIRALIIYIREKEKAHALRSSPPPKPEREKVTRTQHHDYRLKTVAGGFEEPWGICWLPDGTLLVTEKKGRLTAVEPGGGRRVVGGTPESLLHGQGGMMDVAPHPDHARNGWVYLSFNERVPEAAGDDKRCLTAVVRGKIRGGRWVEEQEIYRAAPKHYSAAGVHFGSRLVFSGGYLYFAIGERGGGMTAQRLDNPAGKVFRLHDDGRVPSDNPFVGRPDADPAIWSYGHRNPQGMAFGGDGALYLTEHGPRGGDEFNRVKKGANYGWPVVTYGMNYDGTAMVAETKKEGIEDPLCHWTPSLGVCGLAAYRGEKFPRWNGDFFAGSLRARQLVRLRVEAGRVAQREVVLADIARIRDVKTGPDGCLYLALNDPGEIVRLAP